MSKNLKQDPISRKRITQALVGVAALVFVVGGGLVFWINAHIHALQVAADDKYAIVSSSQQVTKQFQTTQAAFDETRTRIQFLEQSVTQRSYVPTLLKQIQALAHDTQLTVTAVRPAVTVAPPAPVKAVTPPAGGAAPPPPDPGSPAAPAAKAKVVPTDYDTLGVDLQISGSYANTTAFLYKLTKFPKIISVSGLQIHPGSTPKGADPKASPVVVASLHLQAYMFHDDAASVTPDAAAAGKTTLASGIAMPKDAATVTAAATRAAGSAIGASRAGQARQELGVSTL
jgi:Tfp pilus assembly protein PilO